MGLFPTRFPFEAGLEKGGTRVKGIKCVPILISL